MRGKYVSPDVMRRVVEEAEAEGNIALVARRYGLSHSTVSRWRQKYLRGELQVEGTPLDSENVRRLLIENRELKRLLGDKELKIQILEDLVKNGATLRDKVEIAMKWIGKGYPAATVLRQVGLSRSTYYYNWSSTRRRSTGSARNSTPCGRSARRG